MNKRSRFSKWAQIIVHIVSITLVSVAMVRSFDVAWAFVVLTTLQIFNVSLFPFVIYAVLD